MDNTGRIIVFDRTTTELSGVGANGSEFRTVETLFFLC